jgi:hypothetical protein
MLRPTALIGGINYQLEHMDDQGPLPLTGFSLFAYPAVIYSGALCLAVGVVVLLLAYVRFRVGRMSEIPIIKD